MSNGIPRVPRDDFPTPAPPRPFFPPFPRTPRRPPEERLPFPITPALPLPQAPPVTPQFPSRPPFGVPTDVRTLPLPGANEPFGGRIIRIGRVLRGAGLGSIIIIAAEILVEAIARKQLKDMGDILDRQDAEIAQAGIERKRRREFEKDKIIGPGKLLLPEPWIFKPTPGELEMPDIGTAPRPEIPPEIEPAAPPTLPEKLPDIELPPSPFPEIGRPFPLPVPVPTTIPRSPPKPGPVIFPTRTPFPLPPIIPIRAPVAFPISPPVADPLLTPIGDPTLFPLTPVRPTELPSGFVTPLGGPQAQAQAQTERCQVVKRRRRRKGKCREGFFIERPGETQFITWREDECDTKPLGALLEIVK